MKPHLLIFGIGPLVADLQDTGGSEKIKQQARDKRGEEWNRLRLQTQTELLMRAPAPTDKLSLKKKSTKHFLELQSETAFD